MQEEANSACPKTGWFSGSARGKNAFSAQYGRARGIVVFGHDQIRISVTDRKRAVRMKIDADRTDHRKWRRIIPFITPERKGSAPAKTRAPRTRIAKTDTSYFVRRGGQRAVRGKPIDEVFSEQNGSFLK